MDKLSVIVFVFFFFSCNSERTEIKRENLVFPKVLQLKSEEIDVHPEIMGSVVDMALMDDSTLILVDYIKRSHAISIRNMATNSLIKKLAARGKGPGEVISPSFNSFYNSKERKFQLFEPNLKKLIEYEFEEEHEYNINEYVFLSTPQNNGEFNLDLFKVNDYFISTGIGGKYEENRFAIFDKDRVLIDFLGGYPNLGEDLKNEHVTQIMAYAPVVAIKPDKTRLLYCTYIGGVLEIFDISKLPNQIKKIKERVLFPPVYFENIDSHGHIEVRWDDNTIIGFEDAYVTDNYIYTLLNGSLGENYKYPNIITVFDWNANPVSQYVLDVDIRSLAVDEKNEVIYAVTYTEEGNNLVRFDLNL